MVDLKYFHQLRGHVIPKHFSNIKIECIKNQSTAVAFYSFQGNIIKNVFGKSIHKIFQKFLHACRITIHKPLYTTLVLEP